MSVESRIQSAASQNAALLQVLSETDYAPPSLAQHKRYIADLENEIAVLDKKIKQLEIVRAQELKEHESYRDSVMKRFAYKVSRKTEKFESKASKEEREYFDALETEHKAKENRKDLAYRLDQAQTSLPNLQSVADRHTTAQNDLDALYDSIFEGPTPGFPDEDQKEHAAEATLSRYHDIRTRSESEGQAVNLLSDAQKKMKTAQRSMIDAQDYSRMDMFGGGSMVDMMERNALSQAEVQLSQVRVAVAQAQRMSAAVRDLPNVKISHGSLMGDVLFDNIFSDMAFHDKIKASIVELEKAAKALDEQVAAAKQRYAGSQQDLAQAGRELEDSRVGLQKARELAFEKVIGGKF